MIKQWMIALALAMGAQAACDSGETKPGAPAPATQVELSADQVVARNLAALGGVDRLKAMKTLVVRGDYSEDGRTDAFALYRARPNKLRKEGTHEGKAFTKLFDGKTAFLAEGDVPLAPMPADKQAKMAQYADFDDPLVDAAARGHKVELAAAEDVDGARAHHLLLTLASGDVEHRYFDATSFLEVKRTVTFKDKDGAQKTKHVRMSDWRDVNGVKINFASEGEVDGKRSRVVLKEVVVDGPIDPAKFTGPATNVVASAQ